MKNNEGIATFEIGEETTVIRRKNRINKMNKQELDRYKIEEKRDSPNYEIEREIDR